MIEHIELLVIDVDGTLTDAGIYYDEKGNELKKFCTKDAAAFFVAKKVGIKTMVLTGRESQATLRRMKELDVDCLFQNVINKKEKILSYANEKNISLSHIAFIGDDLNDLPAMKIVGAVGCPADACKEVKEVADYVSDINGGRGAVRDIVEHWLMKLDVWKGTAEIMYGR